MRFYYDYFNLKIYFYRAWQFQTKFRSFVSAIAFRPDSSFVSIDNTAGDIKADSPAGRKSFWPLRLFQNLGKKMIDFFGLQGQCRCLGQKELF